jgi:cation diffusion facilitator family transporter
MIVNALLAAAKLVGGLVGNSYALVADAVESTADIFSSLVVWGGLRIAGRDPDDAYPFGYGRAESLAAAVVALMMVAAAAGIAYEAVQEIRTPHHAPAPWTLLVLVGAGGIKWLLARRVRSVGTALDSRAVVADASHHLSDVITSAAAFIGISIAVLGGPGWEAADDWAAVFAAGIILYNGITLLRPALQDLMDRSPGMDIIAPVLEAAERVPGVLATEKLTVRRTGPTYRATIHVQTDPEMSIRDAHVVGGMVKTAIRQAVPQVVSVLVHLEPFEG